MSLLDIILGRTRPVRSKLERLFAMSTACVTLTVNLQLVSIGRAGVCFRPLDSSQFHALQGELDQLLRISGKETSSTIKLQQDSFGFQWVVLQDPHFEDLVTTIHLVSLTLQDRGFADQLLAAVFKFLDEEQPVYWIYNYKRGSFYPFVPSGPGARDNARELRLRAAMEQELPTEPDLERWYPLWGIPV